MIQRRIQKRRQKNLQTNKNNRKWIPHDLLESKMEIHQTYFRFYISNYKQQKTLLQHTITIDKIWISVMDHRK